MHCPANHWYFLLQWSIRPVSSPRFPGKLWVMARHEMRNGKNEKRSTALTQSERFCRSFEGRASVSLGKLAVAKLCRITADMAPESCSQPAAGQRQTRRLWDNWVCSGKQGSELPRLKLGSCQWQHSIQNVQDVDLDVILDANLCKSFFLLKF